MAQGSTLFLRAVVVGIGLLVLGLCVVGLPRLIAAEMTGDFDYGYVFVGMYVPALPFFAALYYAIRLLDLIDKQEAFTQSAVDALARIKQSAVAIAGLYALGMPYIYYLAERDDAPGFAAIGHVIVFAAFVVATAAAVFQRLFQSAVEIKSENDLTV